jgi:hypothetical protein
MTGAAIAERRLLSALMGMARQTLAQVEEGGAR